MIAAGLARYGHKEAVAELLSGMFDAALHLDLQRMPELFCGFRRRPHQGPTQYPVACLPQAWSAGCVFMLLSACLGLEIDAPGNELRIRSPILPDDLQLVRIERLRIGQAMISLEFHRYPHDIGVNVLYRDGPIDVVIVK
jgi:glycogen debranching enzyme